MLPHFSIFIALFTDCTDFLYLLFCLLTVPLERMFHEKRDFIYLVHSYNSQAHYQCLVYGTHSINNLLNEKNKGLWEGLIKQHIFLTLTQCCEIYLTIIFFFFVEHLGISQRTVIFNGTLRNASLVI